MNLASLHDRLIAAARAHPPGDAVPYAFEKRVVARLTNRPVADDWAQWARSLWCGAAACSLIAIGMSIWAQTPDDDVELAMDFSQTIEQTLLPDDAAD